MGGGGRGEDWRRGKKRGRERRGEERAGTQERAHLWFHSLETPCQARANPLESCPPQVFLGGQNSGAHMCSPLALHQQVPACTRADTALSGPQKQGPSHRRLQGITQKLQCRQPKWSLLMEWWGPSRPAGDGVWGMNKDPHSVSGQAGQNLGPS